MVLRASGLAGWRVVCEGDSPVLAHAAAELGAHFALASPDRGNAGTIVLRAGAGAEDGYAVTVDRGRVLIEGTNARGTLNGVYSFLERAGFAWVEPGAVGISFDERAEFEAGSARRVESPSFGKRTLILGQDGWHDGWREWMAWASRNRLNDIFFHDTPPSRLERGGARRPDRWNELAADGGGWMFELWERDGAEIRAEAAKRGMTLQFGGHHLPGLLPRALFADHPEWFPERAGVRDGRYNLCVSSEGARDVVRENARRFFERFPGANVYHLWADDIEGGGWCECAACTELSAADQALTATNLVAGVLAEIAPAADVSHLAYRDTVSSALKVEPAANVRLLWAPRERCYAHAVDDASCPRNRDEFWPRFQSLVASFGGDASRIDLFEYYSDAILFKGLAPTHLAVLPGDARAYHAAGAGNLQNLMVGDRPWIGAPWHAWWMARCAWDAEATPVEALQRFCGAAFPSHAEAMVRYYSALEEAHKALFDLEEMAPVSRRDVLDYSNVPAGALKRKIVDLLEAEAAFGRAWEALPEPSGSEAERSRLTREASQAEAVAYWSGHLIHRTIAWEAALDGETERAQQHLARAEERLSRLRAWDEQWNSPGFAVIASRMRNAMAAYSRQVQRLIDETERR